MGNKNTQEFKLPIEEVRRLEKQTFFNRYEITSLFQVFMNLIEKEKQQQQLALSNQSTTDELNKSNNQQNNKPSVVLIDAAKLSRLVAETSSVLEMKAIMHNPFADKIVEIFASEDDGGMKFEDFLDMCSVFSEHAPAHLKLRVAFYVFDKDGNGRLDKEDVDYVISRMVDDHMVSDQDHPLSIQAARDKLFAEADIDRSGQITLKEFEKLIDRMPDFERRFSFNIRSFLV